MIDFYIGTIKAIMPYPSALDVIHKYFVVMRLVDKVIDWWMDNYKGEPIKL
ncbi:MAG: hypothetical protein ACERKZ_21855 [Lachnotalea sp.]